MNCGHFSDDTGNCFLCDEVIDRQGLSSLVELFPACTQHILAETAELVLLRDISPIVPGHCLIVTKVHMCSFAQAYDKLWDELAWMKQTAIDMLGRNGKSLFFFEHGASPMTPAVGCIAHAHLHVIPLAVDVARHLALVAPHPLEVALIDMKSTLPRNGSDYLYYEDMHAKGCIVIDPKKPLPRQFIRVVVAQEIGLTEWDWTALLIRRVQ